MKLGDYLYGVGTEKDGLVSLRVANIQEDTITLYEHHNGLISQPVNHLTANRAFYPEGYLEPNL